MATNDANKVTEASAGSTAAGHRGAIACGHEVTAAAAREVLEDGGNAFDAAVAAVCAACVAEPVLCSLGGGGYLLARTAGRSTLAYDFFPDTPLKRLPWGEVDLYPIDADFGTTTQRFHIGLGATATPGIPAGLCAIQRELCRLPMRRLVEPAVRAAREGVIVNAFQAGIFRIVAPIYVATEEARRIYGRDATSLPQEGVLFRQPELAASLEQLAEHGPGFFYGGEFARRLVQACKEGGGQISTEDMARYQVIRREPLAVAYRDARILTNPPPSRGGILVAFALALLGDADPSDRAGWLAALAEAMRLTNQARAEEDGSLLDEKLLQRYRKELRARPGCNRGTTHISVVDGDGNVAAVSLSNGEGCGHLLPGTGIMLNNMLGEEDINPDGFQAWQPGTRMASKMAPTLLDHADTLVALGSGGSNRIRSAILQVVCNLVDFDMSLEQAVAAARIHVEGELLSAEHGFTAAELAALASSGLHIHEWPGRSLFFGGVHVVRSSATSLAACGDFRRGGVGLVTVTPA
jgi:gamma-glutamyltranspeptidase/glutathione hydrolase